jgi:geranylgeranyl diphosphate synthase, type I
MGPRLLKRYGDEIEQGLRSALEGETLLYRALRYHVGLEDERGARCRALGKLLRPSLVLFTAEEFRADPTRSRHAAIGLELIHNFSLIHDDIQDRDTVRRGRRTVWSLYGVEQAINAGDLMHTLALSQGLRAGEASLGALLRATAEMIEGQGLDLAFEKEEVTPGAYFEMVDKKTGALIRCALELGGILAGMEGAVVDDLVGLGAALGRAFQIRDDLLGIWGNGQETGKPQGSDIRRRKKAYPVAIVLDRAPQAERDAVRAVYARPEIGQDEVDRVIAVMDRLGIRKAGEEAVSAALDRATGHLERLPFSRDGKDEMSELIDYLARRTK